MKKMINYHTHTYRCGHALGNEYEMVEAALHEGYQELGMSCHIALPHYRSHLLHSLTSIRSLQGLKSCIGALLRNGPKMRMPYNEKQEKVYHLNSTSPDGNVFLLLLGYSFYFP